VFACSFSHTCKVIAAAILLPSLAACAREPSGELHHLMLYPRSSVEIEMHGICRTISNPMRKTIAYIPAASPEAWAAFSTHPKKLEVTLCGR